MKVVDIADEIYRELDSLSSLSIPAIAYWVRSNIGTLNNYINTEYVINSTSFEIEQTLTDNGGTTATTQISEEEKSILKKMYMVYFYETKLRSSIITMDTSTVVEVSDQGSRVRKLNRNEITKTLNATKNQEYEALIRLINAYKLRKSTPLQVAGDDTVEGFYGTDATFNRNKTNTV